MDFGIGLGGNVLIESVKIIYTKSKEVKSNKRAAGNLAMLCVDQQEVLVQLLNDYDTNGVETDAASIVLRRYADSFREKVELIRIDMITWANMKVWKRLAHNSRMASQIQEHTEALDRLWQNLQTGILVQNLAVGAHVRTIVQGNQGGLNPSAASRQQRLEARAADDVDWRNEITGLTSLIAKLKIMVTPQEVAEPEADFNALQNPQEVIADLTADGEENNEPTENNQYRERLAAALQDYYKGNHNPLVTVDPTELTVPIEVHRGERATIYKGIRVTQAVAIKKPNIETGVEAGIVYRRIIRESHIWQQLHHPNIVGFLGFVGPEDEVPYMLSEWMENGNARVFVHAQTEKGVRVDVLKLPLVQLNLWISLEIIEGLLYLQGQSPPIIHGCLKASNVLIDSDGIARLTDFALATTLDPNSQTGSRPPPQRWSSPEVLDGEPYTVESDVFSFACTLYEIITNSDPYNEQKHMYRLTKLIRKGLRPEFPTSDLAKGRGLDSIESPLWLLMQDCWKTIIDLRPSIEVVKTRLMGIRGQLEGQ